jgi:hypothetical protein
MFNKFFKNEYLLIIALYLILGIVFTWPLALNINTQIPNNRYEEANHTFEWGDHLQILAGMIEHKNSLIDVVTNEEIHDKEFCFDDKADCKFDTITLVKKVLLSAYWQQTLLSLIFPAVAAYNISIILSFVTTGIASFLYARYFVNKLLPKQKITTAIAFIASLFTVISPLRIHQMLVGHKSGFLLWILILIMFLFEKYLFIKKDFKRYIIAASVLLPYLAVNEQFLMLLGFGYIASRFVWVELMDKKLDFFTSRKSFVKELLKFSWIPLVLVISYFLNAIGKLDSIKQSVVSNGRDLNEISLYSPQIYDLFTRFNTEHELNLYLGIGLLILTIGLAYTIIKGLMTKTRKDDVSEMTYFLLVICCILLLSLGTNTPLYQFLYEKLPVFRFGRTPIRYAFILFPLISVIFTILFSKLITKHRNLNWGLIIFAAVAVIFSYWDLKPISLANVPEAIETKEFGEKVLFLPYTQPDNFFGSIYEYYIANSNSVTMNGYTPFTNQQEKAFFEEYSSKINEGNMTGEEYNEFADKYEIDTIIVLKDYYGKTDYDLPEAETKVGNIEKINKSLENSNFEKVEDDPQSTIWRKNTDN